MTTRAHRSLRRVPIVCGLLLLPASLVACSDDDSATATSEAPPTDEGATTEGTEDDEVPPTVEVVAVDFAFEGLPDTVAPGTKLSLVNEAETELHEVVAFRLPDDEERSIDEIAALPPEEMQQVLGEPVTVLLAPAGSEQVAAPVGDGTLEEPGRYAIMCFIPTGVAAEEYMAAAATSDGPPQVEGGPPHVAHGMYAEVEVR